MFTLISLGTGAAYAFSVFALLFPGLLPQSLTHGGAVPVYFEAASFIIVLVLLGQVLELRARAGTGEAIRALLGWRQSSPIACATAAKRMSPLEWFARAMSFE